MSTNYYYNDASTSTTWTTGSISQQTRPHAQIIDTKPPAQEWCHVTKISVNNKEYSIGDIVSMRDSGIGTIREFEPERVCVRCVGAKTSQTVYYDNISHIGAKDAKKVKLDPNTAFRYKKKGGAY